MAITYEAVRIPHTHPSVPAAGERRRGTRGQERGWVSGLGLDVVVKEGDAGERCRSVWPSLSCLGLELAAAREVGTVANLADWLIGGAWDVVFVVALECHHHRVAEPGPGPRRAECRRVARTVELARRCSGRLESSKTRR